MRASCLSLHAGTMPSLGVSASSSRGALDQPHGHRHPSYTCLSGSTMQCVKLKLIYDRGLTQEGVSRPTAFSFPSGAALQRLRSVSQDPTARGPRRVPKARSSHGGKLLCACQAKFSYHVLLETQTLQHNTKIAKHKIKGITAIVHYTPPRGSSRFVTGNKRSEIQGALSTHASTADSIINTGPRKAGANPI